MLWDFVKCKVRSETIDYSIRKSRENKQKETELANRLIHLENSLHYNKDNYNEYLIVKEEWENCQKIKLQGSIIRSKVKWVEEGEKNSKYFLNLEKRNHDVKHIKKLITGTKMEITKPNEILKEQRNFYQELYTSKLNSSTSNNIDTFFLNSNIPKLSEEDKQSCEEKLSTEDYLNALKKLSNDKSPGSDGLTTNFYKFFWNDIKELLVECYNYCFLNGQLSQDQRLAVINLIPKKDKDIRYLKNWRPVSLLNTD